MGGVIGRAVPGAKKILIMPGRGSNVFSLVFFDEDDGSVSY